MNLNAVSSCKIIFETNVEDMVAILQLAQQLLCLKSKGVTPIALDWQFDR